MQLTIFHVHLIEAHWLIWFSGQVVQKLQAAARLDAEARAEVRHGVDALGEFGREGVGEVQRVHVRHVGGGAENRLDARRLLVRAADL